MSLKLLAHQLGLSTSTVSRAINDYPDISKATKERVRQAADKLGYKANASARRLVTGHSKNIGLLVPLHSEQHGSELTDSLFSGATAALLPHDYMLSAIAVPENDRELVHLRRLANSHLVDAIILLRTRCDDPRIELLLQHDLPFVCCGRSERADEFAWLDMDNDAAMQLAVHRLVADGHRHISFINADPSFFFAHLRWQSFQRCLQKLAWPVEKNAQINADLTEESGYQHTITLLQRQPDTTALICSSDIIAIGALRACKQAGRAPGRDIAIIGFNNSALARCCEPSLTSIAYKDGYSIGHKLGELVLRRLKGEAITNLQLKLPPKWIARQSSDWVNPYQQQGTQNANNKNDKTHHSLLLADCQRADTGQN